jgi:hypothetical protein
MGRSWVVLPQLIVNLTVSSLLTGICNYDGGLLFAQRIVKLHGQRE